MLSIKTVTATDVVEPAIAGDPLLSNVELPLRRLYHPLGFSMEVITNSEAVLAAAEVSWGGLRKVFADVVAMCRNIGRAAGMSARSWRPVEQPVRIGCGST